MNLTRNQKAQLLALYEASALSRTQAAPTGILGMGNTMVIGKLRDLGLAQSASVGKLGRHWTEYWLTDAGIAEARALALGRRAA